MRDENKLPDKNAGHGPRWTFRLLLCMYCCLEFRVCCGITSVVACGAGVLGDE